MPFPAFCFLSDFGESSEFKELRNRTNGTHQVVAKIFSEGLELLMTVLSSSVNIRKIVALQIDWKVE